VADRVLLETVMPPVFGKESLIVLRFLWFRAPPFEVLFFMLEMVDSVERR